MSCLVTVTDGILCGKECQTFYGKKYYSFEGIPYAKPPVGNLRFKNPEPPEPWKGILDATKPGNKCLQTNPYLGTAIDGSEDCLYLNIYTPILPEEKNQKLPVLFFIHGGRLIFGYGNYYTPDYIIKQDVILVTLNYRLHILGWLCLDIPECPGNAGLKDTALALRWVNKNIASFNGDPNNVTVCGESAGGAMATSFLLSNMTVGMYSKVAAFSGNCIFDLFMVDEDPIEKASSLAAVLGVETKDKYELYNLFLKASVQDLINAYITCEMNRPGPVLNAFLLTVVEKEFPETDRFFTEHPRVSIPANRFEKVPLLLSYNSHESALFFNTSGNIVYESDFSYFVPKYAGLKLDSPKCQEMGRKIGDFYLKGRELDESVKSEYITMISDSYFQRDSMLFAEIVSRFWGQTYVMKFSYMGNMHTRVMKGLKIKGATHGDMMQYQFYRNSKAKDATAKDREIVEFFSESLANFMKNGEPTWRTQRTKWLPYTKKNRCTLLVDDDITLETDLDRDRLLFWMNLLKNHCKL